MNDVLYNVVNAIRVVFISYQPLIPNSAGKVLDMLSVPESERSFEYLDLDKGFEDGVTKIDV